MEACKTVDNIWLHDVRDQVRGSWLGQGLRLDLHLLPKLHDSSYKLRGAPDMVSTREMTTSDNSSYISGCNFLHVCRMQRIGVAACRWCDSKEMNMNK